MKSLTEVSERRAILARLEAVSPADSARWGRMNAQQMLCHLCDSMRVPLGEKAVSDAGLGTMSRKLLKFGALYVPLRWAKNVSTRPEIDQCRLNAQLGHFGVDRQAAVVLVQRLCGTDLEGKSHPFFGPLTHAEWLRWAWLHADHHLRQFGR